MKKNVGNAAASIFAVEEGLPHDDEMRRHMYTLRAEVAEREVVVQRHRAEAFQTALRAIIDDMGKLGLAPVPKPR